MTIEKDGIVDEAYKSDDAKLDQEPDGASDSEVHVENVDAFLPSAWKEENADDEENSTQIEKEPQIWSNEQGMAALGENADKWVADARKLMDAAVSQGYVTKKQLNYFRNYGLGNDPEMIKGLAIIQREAEEKWADIKPSDGSSIRKAQLKQIQSDIEEGLKRLTSEVEARLIRKVGPRSVIG